MKLSLFLILFVFLIGCSKPSETQTSGEDTTQVAEGSLEPAADDSPGGQQLTRLLSNFEVAREAYPSISFHYGNEYQSYTVDYYFEDDFLTWVEIYRSGEEGFAESYLVNKDPEGTFYLHYGTTIDGALGYVGMEDGGDWYSVKPDGMYKPYIAGEGQADKFEYEIEFADAMDFVRTNKSKFKLKDGLYTYEHQRGGNLLPIEYKFSEVLFESNLLSATRFDAAMIKPYLNWWYPLYEDEPGKFFIHKLCNGDESYIKMTVEAGNYRWEEEGAGTTLVYLIKGFEESEGDAMYATIERNGSRLKKTLIMYDFDGPTDRLSIDGRTYTNEPSKYDVVTMKCD